MPNATDQNPDTGPSKYILPYRRLTALARNAEALAEAIKGCAALGPTGFAMVKDLTDSLIVVTKRIQWVERTGDPDYRAIDWDSPEGKALMEKSRKRT